MRSAWPGWPAGPGRSGPGSAGCARCCFYAGLAVLLIAVESPIDYWSDYYFFVHMIQHLLLMFAAPTLVVAGAPWQPLLDGLPGRLGRTATATVLRGGWTRPLRAVDRVPAPAVGLGGHVQRGDGVLAHPGAVRPGGEQPAGAHLADARQFLPGRGAVLAAVHPVAAVRRRMPLVSQAAALVGDQRGHVGAGHGDEHLLHRRPGTRCTATCPGITLPPFADQEIGAAILWVCGDFWAIPSLIYVVALPDHRGRQRGAAVEQILRRGSASRGGWASGRNPVGSSPPLPPSTEP